jgi:DNA polymerase III alpha subunit
MNRNECFRGKVGRKMQRQSNQSASMLIGSIEEIPHDASSQDAFRLKVEVVRITERETSAGDPFWFVKFEDEEQVRFDVVVWESQMRRLCLVEGMKVTLDLRLPKEPYSAYRLV